MAILDTWYGRSLGGQNQSSASQRTDRTYAGKANLFQPVYGPKAPKKTPATQSYATPKQLAEIDARIAARSSSSRRTSSARSSVMAATPTTAAVEPQLTREQQLQIEADAKGLTGIARQRFIEEGVGIREKTKEQKLQIEADKRGLTGIDRQVFIEEGVGMKPKIASSKKYSDITSAEKEAGIATSTPADAGADEVSKEIESRLSELSTSSYAQQAAEGKNLLGLEAPTDADYKALYDAQLAGDDEKYNTLLDVIKSKYETSKESQRQLGAIQTGQTAQFLARSGAFSSAGGRSMVNNQQTANLERIQTLETEEANALAEAANAKREGDLVRLESYLQKADQLREERNNIQLKNVEYGQQLDEQRQEDEERAKQIAVEQASYIGNLTLDQFKSQDPEYIAQIEQRLGMPSNYLRSLAETQDAISKAQSEQAAMEQSMKLFDLAKELPSGMSYQFADGTTIQGFNEPEGKVMQVTTATGDVAFVTIDPATGEVLKNIQLPGLISEIKAARLFGGGSGSGGRGGGGGGGGGRSGSSSLGDYDETDKLLLQLASQGIGKTVGELYANIESQFGVQLPRAEGFDEAAMVDQLEALNIVSDLSDNIAATPGSSYELLAPPTSFRSITMDDGTDVTAILNEDTGTLLGTVDPIITAKEKKKGKGIFGRLWDAVWNNPNTNVTE